MENTKKKVYRVNFENRIGSKVYGNFHLVFTKKSEYEEFIGLPHNEKFDWIVSYDKNRG